MKFRYEKWHELEPLCLPVPKGTTCVILQDHVNAMAGDVVITEDEGCAPHVRDSGNYIHRIGITSLALLPTEKSAPLKLERRVVNAFSHKEFICALCDDGTMWRLKEGLWYKFPPIPQDSING